MWFHTFDHCGCRLLMSGQQYLSTCEALKALHWTIGSSPDSLLLGVWCGTHCKRMALEEGAELGISVRYDDSSLLTDVLAVNKTTDSPLLSMM